MVILTLFWRAQAMGENSHRMIMIRAIIYTALYWPLWWANLWVMSHKPVGMWTVLGKLAFYVNHFYMLINWFLIAKTKDEVDRDTVKYSLFIILILVLIELPTWIYVLSKGSG